MVFSILATNPNLDIEKWNNENSKLKQVIEQDLDKSFGQTGQIVLFIYVGGFEIVVSVWTLRIIELHVALDAVPEIPVWTIVAPIYFLTLQ